MLDKAISITAQAFEGKFDKGGKPYVLHCLYVMNQMNQMNPDDEELMQIAVMHDLIEDTNWTLMDLSHLGFNDRVVSGLDCLTHRESEDYDHYIRRVATNSDAKKVKRVDLKHNSDITRMKGLRQKDFIRLEKYHRAYEYLKD